MNSVILFIIWLRNLGIHFLFLNEANPKVGSGNETMVKVQLVRPDIVTSTINNIEVLLLVE